MGTMMIMRFLMTILLLNLCYRVDVTEAQENAQLQIPPSLVECYNTSYYMDRANRLPSTIETLITLIEKVENSYAYNQDIRQLAVSLIHRFRQDGIQRATGVPATPGIIPYSPTGYQFSKFRILLQRLIPGNAINFPNNTLTREERCSLHFMLSSSIDTRVRGDENSVCSNLAQYRAQRLPRALNNPSQYRVNNFIGDVEILESLQAKANKQGAPSQPGQRLRNTNANSYDYEFSWSEYGYNNNGNSGNGISQCPVENGVVRSQWGTLSAGNLIAGIAAGLQPQMVPLRTLLSLASRRNGYQNAPQIATVNVDNRWAATLAGDLAEVALVQVPVSTNEQATVGAMGAWNSTVMPKWYFLSQRQNLEMTDAEIRGNIDGLILALNIAQWRNQVNSLKLSQLLRMYYSLDGVLGTGIMACNRMDTFQQITNYQQTLIAQTSAFAQVLDREMQLSVTLSPDSIANFSLAASNALINYLPMNDPSCSVSGALPQDVSQRVTAMTNIYIYVDTTWPFYQVQDYVNYLLENLNINPYASSVTLLAAADASCIVNTTNYITDVFQGWNYTTHNNYIQGFNLPTIIRSMQNITSQYMNGQKSNSSVGGRSLVALLVPYMAAVSDSDSNYVTSQLQYLREQMPDLHFIYYAGGTVSRFSTFVQDPTKDLFSLSPATKPSTAGTPVIARIKLTKLLNGPLPTAPYGREPEHITNRTTILSDIFIFLDTSWEYDKVVDYVNYVAQRLNINPYGSSVALLAARDGTTMVNRTFYLTDYYANWNRTSHSSFRAGFSLPLILSKAHVLAENIMKDERNSSSLGGRSMIAILIPSPTAFVYDYDYDYCKKYMNYLNTSMPALTFLYYAGGTIIRFEDFVNDRKEDLYSLNYDLAVKTAGEPLVRRIKKVPRRLSNPSCPAYWKPLSTGPNQLIQYTGLGHVNFYRLYSQYFFSEGSMRYLKVKPLSPVAFIVCTSRSHRWPHRDPLSPYTEGIDCKQITTMDFSFDLGDLCSNYDTLNDCPPLYVSVQAQSFAEANQLNCQDPACSTPHETKFAIVLNNLDCTNKAASKELVKMAYLIPLYFVVKFIF